jgi:hypothetical protein
MLTTSEYPQMFRFFEELEKRFHFVDRMAEKLGLTTPANTDSIESAFMDKLEELEGAKKGTSYKGEVEELRNFWDNACNSLGILEDSLYTVEAESNEADKQREELGHALDSMDTILHGMETLENSK